ncbi:hypothetical protein BKA67DRAFT_664172 [Truncatella angustata]|uniref:Uncharacterized protein n=1 Tax=Truncatella angustata TaxID=152316 RepID=A0A9P8RN86_9PEZI|nr:uncharacterized protein BKA67DRAFT_664172 [Truncatella angustata]KAH6646330.1 hypothetical protein BKA67DRAFT_664172 [Truncatella angustata]
MSAGSGPEQKASDHDAQAQPTSQHQNANTIPSTANAHSSMSPLERWQAQAIREEPWNNIMSVDVTRRSSGTTGSGAGQASSCDGIAGSVDTK